MTYIRIVDWDKFQHYSKRNPPWIKLYAWLLDNDDFEALPDHCKLLLVMLWLIASRKQNAIRLDEKILNKKLPIHRKIKMPEDIQPLIDAGFIECYQDDSSLQATCLPQKRQRRDREETEREKNIYLDFVKLTDEEHRKLKDKFADTLSDKLQALNDYLGSKGVKYKSHYHTILNWDRKRERERTSKSKSSKTKLFPISGKTCSKQGCPLPAVYKNTTGNYDSYACAEHMPEKVKEQYA